MKQTDFLLSVEQHFFSSHLKVMLPNQHFCFSPTQHLSMVKALRNSFRPLTPSVCGSWLQFFGKFQRLILHFTPVDSQSNSPITPCDDNSNITWCVRISQREEIGQSPGLDTALWWTQSSGRLMIVMMITWSSDADRSQIRRWRRCRRDCDTKSCSNWGLINQFIFLGVLQDHMVGLDTWRWTELPLLFSNSLTHQNLLQKIHFHFSKAAVCPGLGFALQPHAIQGLDGERWLVLCVCMLSCKQQTTTDMTFVLTHPCILPLSKTAYHKIYFFFHWGLM